MTREQMRDELAMLMGGRVAEEIVAGDVTTGAANDIERATKVARQMVTEYGMSDTIGPRTLGQKQGGEVFLGRDWGSTPDYSDAVAFEIDQEVRQLIDEAHDVALDILVENREKLDALAAVLLEKETLDREAVEQFFRDVEKRAPREAEERSAGLGVSRREPEEARASPVESRNARRPRPGAGVDRPSLAAPCVRVECGRPDRTEGKMSRTVRALVAIGVVAASVVTAIPAGAARGPKTWVVLPSESCRRRSTRRMPATPSCSCRCVHAIRHDHEGRHLDPGGRFGFRWHRLQAAGKAPQEPLHAGLGRCRRLRSRQVRRSRRGHQARRRRDRVRDHVRRLAVHGRVRVRNDRPSHHDNAVFDAGEYGLARFDSIGGVVKNNTVVGGGEAGDLPRRLRGCRSQGHAQRGVRAQFGIFIRHSSGISAQLNHLFNNCQGIMVLDDGQAGGVSDIELKYNYVTFNNAAARRRTKLRPCRVAASCCWGPRTRWSRGTRCAGTPAPRSTRAASC